MVKVPALEISDSPNGLRNGAEHALDAEVMAQLEAELLSEWYTS